MFKKGLAFSGILASLLMLQMNGYAAPDSRRSEAPAAKSATTIIKAADIAALRAGNFLTVDLTSDTEYRIEFSSLADLDSIHVLADDGEHVLGESAQIEGKVGSGTLVLSRTDAKLIPGTGEGAVQQGGFCIQVCCWHLLCFVQN